MNVVVTASVGRTIDLMLAATSLPNAEYFPAKFAALKLCRTDPYAKALVFTSGKMVCVGSVSTELAKESLHWFIEQIQGTMPEKPLLVRDITIQNIVGTTQLSNLVKRININRVFRSASQNVQYEPEMFPGLSFRPDMAKQLIMNVFASGKCVLTGAKTYEELRELFASFQSNVSNEVFW